MAHATKTSADAQQKPPKPYEGFPLFPHDSGMWAKKIRSRLIYFTSWREDPDGGKALGKFNREWPYLKDGLTPPPEHISQDGCTVRDACNDFLDEKNAKLKAAELSPLTFAGYFQTCEKLVDHFGPDRRVDDLRPEDFRSLRTKLAKRYGVQRLNSEISRIRGVFIHAFDNDLIEKPVRFGTSFDRPSSRHMRKHKNESGKKVFSRGEVLKLIRAADVHLRAMIYLGINAGLGPMDLGTLPKSALDLETGWLDYPRGKTHIERRVPLWPETTQAVWESLEKRPSPAEKKDEGLVFLTRYGRPWVRFKARDGKPDSMINSVTLVFGRLMKDVGINGRRGRGHYTLRHVLETIGGECRDQIAVDHCMGHVSPGMGSVYRHSISDQRLLNVVNTVRGWLFPEEESAE